MYIYIKTSLINLHTKLYVDLAGLIESSAAFACLRRTPFIGTGTITKLIIPNQDKNFQCKDIMYRSFGRFKAIPTICTNFDSQI